MIHVKRTKYSGFHTAITSTGGTKVPSEVQLASIANICSSGSFPYVNVLGPIEPPRQNGLRYFKSNVPVPVKRALGSYLVSIPGNEVCMLSEAEFTITGKPEAIFSKAVAEKIELNWGAFVSVNGAPRCFMFTTSIASHLMMAIQDNLCFGENWQTPVHGFLQGMLRFRYFDASEFGFIAQIEHQKKEEPVKPAKRKKNG